MPEENKLDGTPSVVNLGQKQTSNTMDIETLNQIVEWTSLATFALLLTAVCWGLA